MQSSKTLTNELQLQLTNYEKNKLFEINELDLSIQQLQEHNQLQGINVRLYIYIINMATSYENYRIYMKKGIISWKVYL